MYLFDAEVSLIGSAEEIGSKLFLICKRLDLHYY